MPDYLFSIPILIVNSLAVYRLTRLVTIDVVFQPVRSWVVLRNDTWAYFITCAWCVSVWVSVIAVLGSWFLPAFWLPLALVLALSAVAGMLSNFDD